MTGAVAAHSAATAPRERGWRWFLLGLVAVVLVTAAPAWPPALALGAGVVRLALPFEPVALLVLVAFASCAVLGWWSGGRTFAAVVTVGFIGWVLFKVPVPATPFGSFVRGWLLSLGAAFGLVCLAGGSRAFLNRALAAVTLAGVVAGIGVGARSAEAGPLAATVQLFEQDYQRRIDGALAGWRDRTQSVMWQSFASRVPLVAARGEKLAGQFQELQRNAETRAGSLLVLLSPSLLMLESMLALALGWAGYHRLARTRIGPPLGELRDLRFNDQLIWGLVTGAVLVMQPALIELRVAGLNLLSFFGALYALRGAGVCSWWIPERWTFPLLMVFVVLVSLLGPTLVLMAMAAICFGVGLSDTWRDFRKPAHAR
ncbi:MAG: DUF2232 domain-containing protein [Gemmatimonas sp.]